MATLAELKAIATEIKNEMAVGGNTAAKVGALIEGVIDAEIEQKGFIETLNGTVFPTPEYVSIPSEGSIDLSIANHKVVAISAVTEHAKLNLPANAARGTRFNIINIGQRELDITPAGDDKINNSAAKYVLGIGLCVTILKFEAEGLVGWVIIAS